MTTQLIIDIILHILHILQYFIFNEIDSSDVGFVVFWIFYDLVTIICIFNRNYKTYRFLEVLFGFTLFLTVVTTILQTYFSFSDVLVLAFVLYHIYMFIITKNDIKTKEYFLS